MTSATSEKPELREPATSLLRSRMPELDTIRGIAVLLVVFFHGFGFRYGLQGLSGLPKLFVAATLPGWMGVNLFFVLSGFLITGILLDSRLKKNYFRTFYVRRALRILPLYYAVLLVLAVLTRTGWVDRQASWAYLGLSFLYLSNVTELFGVPSQYSVLWSLAVEEHFYLLWPAAVRVLSRQRVMIVSICICVLCPCLRAFCFIRGYDSGARIYLAGGGRTGVGRRAGRSGSWSVGYTRGNVARHEGCIGYQPDRLWCGLSARNIPFQQALGIDFAADGAEPLLCSDHSISAFSRNLPLESAGESASAAVLWRNQLRRLSDSHAGL